MGTLLMTLFGGFIGQEDRVYILDNGGLVQNKRVLDFGCGCGASGLSSMKMEAKSVIFNDIDEAALIAVEQNGAINGIPVDVLTSSNLIGNDCKEVDVVLVGDMLYDTEFAAQVLNWLLELSKKNKKVLIGDPRRFVLNSHPLKDLLKCVAKYRLHPNTILENNGFQEAFVWELTHL